MRAVKIKMRNIATLFFSLFLTLAVFSQISAKPTSLVGFGSGKNLQPTTYNLKPSDWLYYKSSNDLSAHLGKKDTKLPTVRYQKSGDYLEFSMTGAGYSYPVPNPYNLTPNTYNLTPISSTTSVSLETDTKTPNTPTLFYRNILDGVDANYQINNIPFKVKEEIVLKKVLGVSELGFRDGNNNLIPNTYNLKPITFLFSAETSGKPVKQKDGSIAFFDNDNNYLFQLDKPFMIDGKGNRSEEVSLEIKPAQTKNTSEEMFFGDSNLERKSGLSPVIDKYTGIKTFVNSLYNKYMNNKKVLDLGGIEPPDSQVTNRSPHQVRPRAGLVYHKPKPNPHNLTPENYQIILSADSNWLSTATYPVIIDPTVTHNADANFTGQFNRIADSDTTSSTQLESSYPEATKDPYTVLLLHFNEANGTTAGIRDYASTTRVITANGNASTTSYVTQLGLGNSAAFDGTGDYLSLADSDDWAFGSGNFSVSFWIRYSSIGSSIYIYYQQDASIVPGILIANETPTGKFRVGLSSSSAWDVAHPNTFISTTAAVVGNWYHVAVVRNGSTAKLFINGIQENIVNVGTATLHNDASPLYIGANSGSTEFVNGYMDEIRVIKGRALTPEEIKAAASRRPYAVYTSPVLDASASVQWDTLNWTEGGVNTGNGEQPYSTNSLVAQWDFNDTSGTTLTASSSGSCTTACNGTLNGFAYTASQDQATTTTGWTANNKKWGAGSLMFDGTNDYVSVNSGAVTLSGFTSFTATMWVNQSSIVGGDASALISNDQAGNTPYVFYINTSRQPYWYLNTANGTFNVTSPVSIDFGKWNFLTYIYNGSTMSIYINGIFATSTSATGTMDTAANAVMRIGVRSDGLLPFNGIIDSTAIYSRALSAAEILSNYQAGNIEIQTRSGATSDPNDGSWEAWKPTTGETQLLSMDNDAVNWHSDIMASTTIATSTETVIKAEGTGSLKIRTGMASTTAGTVALWHFEETGTTTGTYLYDETANNNDATTTGTTVVDGIFGKARKFNGTSDVVSALALTGGTAVQSVDFWIYPMTTTEYFIDLNGSAYVWANAGTITATGFTSPTIYVNGAVSSIIVAGQWQHIAVTTGTGINASVPKIGKTTTNYLEGTIDETRISNRVLSADEIAETYRMGANHYLTRQVSATDLSGANKLAFNVASDRPGTYLEAMLGESDYANYELASSTLALSTTTVLYIKGDEIASSASIKDSSFSGKAITANGNARTAGGGKIGNAVYFDGTGDYLTTPSSSDFSFGSGDFAIDMWVYPTSNPNAITGVMGLGATTGDSYIYTKHSASSGNMQASMRSTGDVVTYIYTTTPISLNVWQHIALVRNGNNLNFYLNSNLIGSADVTGKTMVASANALAIGKDDAGGAWPFFGYIDESRVIKGSTLTPDQIRQAYEYGLRTHPITIDFGATLQSSDLISSATDYNFSLTATTSGLSATTSGLYLGDKIIIKENLGGTEYAAQGTVNAINTTTGAITVPSWDSGSTFPASNGYSPNATVFKWQREYFDLTGAATTTRDAITNLTLRPTNGAEGRTVYLDDFRYNTNYLTASSSSAITSSNGRYLQYRAIFSSWDSFVSPYLSAFNTLYTAAANSFPSLIGISSGGFLSF